MSASPMARRLSESKAIPIRRVALHDPSELPHDYSSTPGGTLYSTTPGGTKIVYEKSFLMKLSSSPIARTPPTCDIPEALLKGTPNKMPPKQRKPKTNKTHTADNHDNNRYHDDEQFQMDI